MSHAELKAVANELQRVLAGSRIQKVRLLTSASLALECFAPQNEEITGTRKPWLLISAWPGALRTYLLPEAPIQASPDALPSLFAQLKQFTIERVSGLTSAPCIEFALRGKEGEAWVLVLDAGKPPAIVLLNEEREILACLAQQGASRLSTGNHWEPKATGVDMNSNPLPPDLANASGLLSPLLAARYADHRDADLQRESVGKSDAALAVNELRKLIKSVGRARTKAGQDLARHESGLQARNDADALKANLHMLTNVRGSATVTEWDADGSQQTRTIALQEGEYPAQAMQRLYRQAARAERGVAQTRERLAQLEGQLSALKALQSALAGTTQMTHEHRAELGRFGITIERETTSPALRASNPAPPQPRSAFAELPASQRPRQYSSNDGWDILVGRGDSGNDILTTRIANGNDWFFHVSGTPGSHVILRNEGGKTPPLETLLDCAHLAIHFSKMKDASRASVSYTQRKHVKKPKGAKAGLVVLSQHKELSVRIEPLRLHRLLGKAIG